MSPDEIARIEDLVNARVELRMARARLLHAVGRDTGEAPAQVP